MCEQCNDKKTIWVKAGSIAQCQPCMKCNVAKKNSLETIKKLFEYKEEREKGVLWATESGIAVVRLEK